jgi:hypothetical protein
MRQYPIADPLTFHLRHRILMTAGVPFHVRGDQLELDQDLDMLPPAKQKLVRAALECHLDWHALTGITNKEKVAVGVAAMEVDRYRAASSHHPV